MDTDKMKYFSKSQLKRLSRSIVITIILTLTAITTVYVYAAFVEPTFSPSDSDQDFAENILGANNSSVRLKFL